MVLSDVASIATAVSGLVVTASLIYVGIQTKQNVRHTRALIHQGTAARTTSILLGFMNAEIVSAWIEGNGGTATPELIRQRQFHYHCGIAMIAMEDYFSQHEDGLLKHRETMTKAAPRYCAFIDSLCGGEPMTPVELDFHQNRNRKSESDRKDCTKPVQRL